MHCGFHSSRHSTNSTAIVAPRCAIRALRIQQPWCRFGGSRAQFTTFGSEASCQSVSRRSDEGGKFFTLDGDASCGRTPRLRRFPLRNRRQFDEATNFGEKSDVLRYEILFQLGGVYVDADMECLRALDGLHATVDFYAGISNSGTIELNNAIIGARPGHPIISACIQRVASPPPGTFNFGNYVVKQREQSISKQALATVCAHDRTGVLRLRVATAGPWWPRCGLIGSLLITQSQS